MLEQWMCFIAATVLCSVIVVYAKPANEPVPILDKLKCGYESCPATLPGKLNIHLVPHSHDDVGWLKTVDQYYYGSSTLTQKAGVQYILDSVVHELLRDSSRRFVYVESAFFFKWWKEQSEELQDKVKELVNEGRLEFLGGAWSMNDEATTHYQSIIDQFTLGLRLLNETFGECGRPRVGWQIDPFGHSREMASIFAQMGFDGMFFARLDYEDKMKRLLSKDAEMIWHGSNSLGVDSDLFTGFLYNHYSSPPGFCFDVLCSDEPMIDGKHSPENNVNRKLDSLTNYLQKMAQQYKTNHLLVPMGDDFHYQDANMWYTNLDKVIKYANARQANGSDLNFFYSTPSCYLKSLHETGTNWPTKSEDFFPYASDPTAFWTGYYTSRPTLKNFERVGNHFLQICKQLTASDPNLSDTLLSNLDKLREIMGIMQHHDAITGTEKRIVALDYARQLSEGIAGCSANVKSLLNKWVMKTGGQLPKFEFESCLNLNISNCEISEKSDQFMLTVYNPLSHNTSQYVRVPIQDLGYIVKDHEGNIIVSQIVPIPKPIRDLHFRFSVALKELVFYAKDVPSNGFRSYYIALDMTDPKNVVPEVKVIRKPRSATNDKISISFDNKGHLRSIKANGITRDVYQKFFYYDGASGNNMEHANRSSGAYIFRPNNTEHLISDHADVEVIHGPLVDEVHQKFNDWVSQVIRLYKTTPYVEFEWLVGPIPIDNDIGKEVISRFSTNLGSNGEFYTDSNGRQTLKRSRNKREDFEPTLAEKIAGNYYPVTNKIALEDEEARLAVLNDRAQGGSSLTDGTVELMVHRRLLYDDGFGVNEPLNSVDFGEGTVARGKHWLTLGPSKSDIRIRERQVQLEKTLPLWMFFSDLKGFTFEEWQSSFVHLKSLWQMRLPTNLHLMTLEPLGGQGNNELLIRFEHILEKTDDPAGTQPITFDLTEFLTSIGYTSIRETTLAGNLWLNEMKRLQFNTNENAVLSPSITAAYSVPRDIANITLKPMEIATFIVGHK